MALDAQFQFEKKNMQKNNEVDYRKHPNLYLIDFIQ